MTVIDDAALDAVAATCGLAAMGLYAMLERRVNKDGRWVCTIGSLATACRQTERHVRDAAKSLEDAGFITRTTISGYGGMTIGVEWYLPKHLRTYRTEPTPEPGAEPTPEPSRAHVKEISNSQVITSNGHSPKPTRKRTEYSENFETFWRAYPSGHGTKSVAFVEWNKLDINEQIAAIETLPVFTASRRWKEGYIKDAERYLKYRQWESPPVADAGPVNHNKGGRMKVVL
jgi:hypothetical protein